MSWVAEILRKNHRACRRCEMGPTHVYRPEPARVEETGSMDPPLTGTPLCNSCLSEQIERDFSAYGGRCLLFEPALGPECLLFAPLPAAALAAAQPAAARAALERAAGPCAGCGAGSHFVWVGVEPDANLWEEDLLPGLQRGELAASDPLCGRCAARRLMRSIEQRGLYFEGITVPAGADGLLRCAEM
jgi:hypothetical protein